MNMYYYRLHKLSTCIYIHTNIYKYIYMYIIFYSERINMFAPQHQNKKLDTLFWLSLYSVNGRGVSLCKYFDRDCRHSCTQQQRQL